MTEEKQIEEMARTLCGEKSGSCEDCDSYQMCEFWLEASTLLHAGYRKQREWISVDDALPNSCEEVLAFDGISIRLGYYGDFGWEELYIEECCCKFVSGKITHWMPLPEPPKMKGGE